MSDASSTNVDRVLNIGDLMVWVAAIFFALVGIYLIVRRRDVARGQSLLLWGGTTPPGCVVGQGILLILLGVLFLVAREMGWIGG